MLNLQLPLLPLLPMLLLIPLLKKDKNKKKKDNSLKPLLLLLDFPLLIIYHKSKEILKKLLLMISLKPYNQILLMEKNLKEFIN